MGEKTKISWCDSTFNPWIGCSKVSAGCQNCYAERQVKRWGNDFSKRRRSVESNWRHPVKWNKSGGVCVDCGTTGWDDCECGQLGDCGKSRKARVFCGSMMDWLDNAVPVEWLADLMQLIHDTPNLNWLLLSKRPENFDRRLLDAQLHLIDGCRRASPQEMRHKMASTAAWLAYWRPGEHLPSNVLLGTTVENQDNERRIKDLLAIPAKVRFLSCEPLLGPVDLEHVRWKTMNDHHGKPQPDHYEDVLRSGGTGMVPKIDWVIVGGESGPKARPCNVEWIRDIVRQCKAAGVACFVKQLGAHPVWETTSDGHEMLRRIKNPKGADPSEWPEDLRVQEWPKI